MTMRRRTKESKTWLISLINGTTLIAALTFGVLGQVVLQAPKPKPLPNRLAERLELLIEYERAHQWDKVYGLLDHPTVSKDEYVLRKQALHRRRDNIAFDLIEFTCRDMVWIPPEKKWFAVGCAKIRVKGSITRASATVRVVEREGDWYLSEVIVDLQKNGKLAPCEKACQQ